jgi:hypothetical protein
VYITIISFFAKKKEGNTICFYDKVKLLLYRDIAVIVYAPTHESASIQASHLMDWQIT